MVRMIYSQEATYWGGAVPSGTGGYTYDAPVTVLVRWEERTEQFTNEVGDLEISNAVVWVSQDMNVNEYLALGDHTATADPDLIPGAYIIRRYMRIPDLRSLQSERRVYL